MTASAVVFAYSDVGVRCLKALISAGIDIRLVVTHEDDPDESRWFGSVANVAADYRIACIAPASTDDPVLNERLVRLAPDFIFSFYYRFLLTPQQLACARKRALNLHGSLLPQFRGRAPVNWAILSGATESGATLHEMIERADSGPIVDQLAVPILSDDDALAVFRKVAVAAEIVLSRSLPGLIDGSARFVAQLPGIGKTYGRRRPEDGRIDWSRSAQEIHNLIRAVAPPYPGAYTIIGGKRWFISRARILTQNAPSASAPLHLIDVDGRCVAVCGDGRLLQLLEAHTTDGMIDLRGLAIQLTAGPLPLQRSCST
ncbi:MAG: formyltransferase [Pseudomonadota bacterium]